ncbi:MAG: hypothetical protein A2075_16405 [Geobacteraceae bacterium GWC2_58_44]|nr:MAG: hypothetical protein A2075_16405 [Geobacteraceae bacterium GWC2_58_44]
MMPRLYFKILFNWVAALIVMEVLIFAVILFVVKDSHHSYVIQTIGGNALMARDYLEAAVAADAGGREPSRDALQSAVTRLGHTARAKVWVSGADGTVVASSVAGKVPVPPVHAGKSGRHGDAQVHLDLGPARVTYSSVPLTLKTATGQGGTLHVLTERDPGPFPVGKVGAGLAIIGAIAAIAAIPLSRHITEPLNRLQESAVRIAGGDLSARVEVQGRDEIGRLGMAFNGMAQTVERLVRSGRELTANVSHEMRSPLARIRIAGECLKQSIARGDRDDCDELLEGMWEDISQADRLIGRILEYSKLDLHERVAAKTEVFPAPILEGLLKIMRPVFLTRGVSVEMTGDLRLSVAGDEDWLRSAFGNLLDNAARYTPEGGVVRIALRPEGDAVAVEVTNSAAPVAAEDLEKIFDPFYRGKGAKGEGTGLGLAITRKIVVLHGGEIAARNTPQGFQVSLRLVSFPSSSSV